MNLKAGVTRVMRNDGQYDVVESITSETEKSAVVVLSDAQRSATVEKNENGVWQEPWAESAVGRAE